MVRSKATFDHNNLSVGLLNINSLKKKGKLSHVKDIVKRNKLHILAVCETKLGPDISENDVNIEGYRLWRKDRNRRGGGVALYVANHVYTKLNPDLRIPGIEVIWIEMILPHGSLLVGCCYRPGADNKEDLNQICEMMKLASKEKREILLMGDFNINWFENDPNKRKIDSESQECGLIQIVDLPTREKQTKLRFTSTCIDHIYTNRPEMCYDIRSEQIDFSDHNLITFKMNKIVPEAVTRL